MELKTTYKEIIKDIKKLLEPRKQKIVVVSHYNPDGDAIGSMLGLYLYLQSNGYEVTAISPDDFPPFLNWMPGAKEILIHMFKSKKAEKKIKEAETLFLVDFNHPERLNELEDCILHSTAKKILIDHHPHPDEFADILYSDTSSSSTAELIFKLIKEISGNDIPDRSIAECLFVGIMTDTGCFSFNSSQPETYCIVATLLQSGINKDLIFSSIYENYSQHRMKLLGYCLKDKMMVYKEYHTAIISLTQKELAEHFYQPGDTEGFVNYPFSIKDLVFTALLIEKKDHIRMSFRSKNTFAAHDFARKHFNGGGHINAAGGKSFISLDETIEKFVNLLPQYKSELKNALLP